MGEADQHDVVELRDALAGLTHLIAAGQTYRVAAAEYFGLSVTDSHAITFLDVHGAVPQSALADLMGVTTAGATGLVDRLEAAGLADRTPDLGDRRKYRVQLTARARQLIEDSGARLMRVFDDVGTSELRILGEAWSKVGTGLQRAAKELRDDPKPWSGPPSSTDPGADG